MVIETGLLTEEIPVGMMGAGAGGDDRAAVTRARTVEEEEAAEDIELAVGLFVDVVGRLPFARIAEGDTKWSKFCRRWHREGERGVVC